ncbi:MAG: tetratricopeptide repeat protein [Chloroflexota bacterium]
MIANEQHERISVFQIYLEIHIEEMNSLRQYNRTATPRRNLAANHQKEILKHTHDAFVNYEPLHWLVAKTYYTLYELLKANGGWSLIITIWKSEAIPAAQSSGDKELLLGLITQLGITHSNRGMFQQAEEIYKEGIDLISCTPNLSMGAQISIMLQYGVCFVKQKRLSNAEKILQKAASLAKIHQAGYSLGFVYNQLSNIAIEKSQFERSLSYLDKGMAIWIELDEDERMGRIVHYGRGKTFMASGDFHQALVELKKALYINEKLNDLEGAGRCAERIGTTLLKMSKLVEAEEYFHRALVYGYKEMVFDYNCVTRSHIGLLIIAVRRLRLHQWHPRVLNIIEDIRRSQQTKTQSTVIACCIVGQELLLHVMRLLMILISDKLTKLKVLHSYLKQAE